MITIKNCQVINCGSVFGLGGDVNLSIDGLYVRNCDSVYDIESEHSNINAHAKNLHVSETKNYIRVGGEAISSKAPSPQPSSSPVPLIDDNQSMMRIALQYIHATTENSDYT